MTRSACPAPLDDSLGRMTGRADIVVVGAGAAGCALAARLTEDGTREVLLLEAGPAPTRMLDFPPELLDAATVQGADPAHPANWAFAAQLTPERPYTIARGRITGGSTTINGGYFMRARREDFDRWAAALGSADGDEWRYEHVLPLMRRLESDLDFGSTTLHGASGPMPVSRVQPRSPVVDAFHDAATQLGYPQEEDKNGEQPAGIGPVPRNVLDGVRVNAALAYLDPVITRDNLRVRGGIRARRITTVNGRVSGVEVVGPDGAELIDADEVVLCAGAFGSAGLLLASGLGGPGVGAGFSDHPQLVVEWRPRVPLPRPADAWMAGALNLAGPLIGELLPSVVPTRTLLGGRPGDGTQPLPVHVSDLTPRRRGRLRLGPGGELDIDYGYLADAADAERLRSLVRTTAGLLTNAAFDDLSVGLVELDSRILRDDDALDAWIRSHLGTSLHSCGTAPFGPEGDPASVVDGQGRVFGTDGLRVADTAILPTAPTRGPAATAVLIGELIADAMR